MAERMEISELRRLVSHVEGMREKRMPVWRELSHFMLPSRGQFPGEERENQRNRVRFNNIASRELRKAAAGLTEAMTPASMPWFRHDFVDRNQREVTFAREYADAVDERIGSILSKGKFYQAIHSFNQDLLCFGCALLYAEESPLTLMRFTSLPIGSYAVSLDDEGDLDFVVHRMFFTPKAMEKRFGKSKMSDRAQTLLKTKPYEEVELVHVVCKRKSADPQYEDALSKPWASYWYEAEANGCDYLAESGYDDMPFMFTTWVEGRGVYGVGPGDEAITDTKGVESWEMYKTIGLEKFIDPPLMIPGQLKDRIDTNPGGRNVVLGSGQGQGISPLYQINWGQALQFVQQEIQNVMQRVSDSLMASVFTSVALDQRPAQMSATEFMARRREMAQQTGPAIAMYEPQVLDKVLSRVFNVAQKLGIMPQPPEGLGQNFLLISQYLGPLSQMLRQTGADSTRQLLADVTAMAQIDPNVLDKIDMDQVIDELARGVAAPGSVVRSDDQVAEIRQQRAQAQAQAQQQQMALEEQKNNIAAANISTKDTLAGAMMAQ